MPETIETMEKRNKRRKSEDEENRDEKLLLVFVIISILGVALGFCLAYYYGVFHGYHLAMQELHIVPAVIRLQ